jgi:hypothetical protein
VAGAGRRREPLDPNVDAGRQSALQRALNGTGQFIQFFSLFITEMNITWLSKPKTLAILHRLR